MNKLICVILALLITGIAQGTTLPQLKVEELFKQADVVVIAEIKSGHKVLAGEFPCGAKYQANIIHSLKGNLKKGSIVEFGPYEGHSIGKKYLLFLKNKGQRYTPMMSSNSGHLNAIREFEEKCAAIEAEYNIMFQGLGALEISFTSKFNYKDAILFPERWIIPPEGLERKPAEAEDNKIPSSETWVSEEAFVEYVNGLK